MPWSTHNLPFPPRRWPFFYGWFVLGVGTLGTLASAPGQTAGVAAFTEPLLGVLALDRTGLSLAYMLGTVGSALMLTWAGRLYDRWGARVVGTTAAGLLGAVLFYLSQVDRVALRLEDVFPRGWAALVAVTVGFLLVRFSGQGVLTLVSRNMVMKWFDHRRGLANGIMSAVLPLAFSFCPVGFHMAIGEWGWRSAWVGAGLILLLGFTVFTLVFYRDNPEACGLQPDGGLPPSPDDPPHDPEGDYTLAQARRTRAFWLYNLGVALYALFATALAFHVVSIYGSAGIDEKRAFAAFVPSSVIAIATGFLAGWLSDHVRLRYLMAAYLAGLATAMIGVFLLPLGFGYHVIIAGNGLAGGIFGVLASVTWPRFFGRTHLGAISGFHMSWVVAGSALGPFLFGVSLQYAGGYELAVWLCLAATAALTLLALRTDDPPRSPTSAK